MKNLRNDLAQKDFKDLKCMFEEYEIDDLKRMLFDFRLVKIFMSVEEYKNNKLNIKEYEILYYNKFIVFKDVYIIKASNIKNNKYVFKFLDKIENIEISQQFSYTDVLIFQDFNEMIEEQKLTKFN
jgi:hypothetical protein